jgi:hypothetical protein
MRAPLVAVVTSMPLVRRLPRRVRTALLVVHVATSAGWLGLDGALVALQVTGLHSGDPAARPGIAIAMAAIACWVLIPVVFAALCSGLVLALGTPWGLARHWWVLAKSGIAVVLTTTGAALMLPHLPPVFAGESELGGVQTLAARSVALVLLLAAMGLSVVKPWGKVGLAGARGTHPTVIARNIGAGRPVAALRAVHPNALDDLYAQGAGPAQLHALRALDGQRNLRVLPDEPGVAARRVLVTGSRTWAASAGAVAVVRPPDSAVTGSRRWPPRWSRPVS